MKMAIENVYRKTIELGLTAPRMYLFALKFYPELVDEVCDGVGHNSCFLQRLLIPDTVLGVNINPASHIHDWEYIFPLYYPWMSVGEVNRCEADSNFISNCHKIFQDTKLAAIRTAIVDSIHKPVLRKFGSLAFWEERIEAKDWDKVYTYYHCGVHYEKHPTENRYILGDMAKYDRYREIYEFLTKKMKCKHEPYFQPVCDGKYYRGC